MYFHNVANCKICCGGKSEKQCCGGEFTDYVIMVVNTVKHQSICTHIDNVHAVFLRLHKFSTLQSGLFPY